MAVAFLCLKSSLPSFLYSCNIFFPYLFTIQFYVNHISHCIIINLNFNGEKTTIYFYLCESIEQELHKKISSSP